MALSIQVLAQPGWSVAVVQRHAEAMVGVELRGGEEASLGQYPIDPKVTTILA